MGQDKALLPFLGRPLIQHLADRLRRVGDELLVTTNQPEAYGFLGLPLFEDVQPGLGALGGLYTALSVARQPLVAVVACDMPFVSPALLAAERDLVVAEAADVVIPRSTEGLEPLHAIYRKETCLPAVQTALQAGERKMISWFPSMRVCVMELSEIRAFDPQLNCFLNVNTPSEFKRAEELARGLADEQ